MITNNFILKQEAYRNVKVFVEFSLNTEDLANEYGEERVRLVKSEFPHIANFSVEFLLDDWKEESLFIKEDKEKYFKGEVSWKSTYNLFEKFGCYWKYD